MAICLTRNTLLSATFALILPAISMPRAEVWHDGSFRHSWPLKLPIATGGLAPQLSLEYQSRSEGMFISPGFEIAGLWKIERLALGRGVEYRGNDTYTGPHGRLVDVSGNRTVFHSQQESFVRYEPLYGSCGAIATEPCSWKMTTPDGIKYYFGTTYDSVAWYKNDAWETSGNAIRAWHLSKVEDLHGNFYILNYETSDNLPHINSIIYTPDAGGGGNSVSRRSLWV